MKIELEMKMKLQYLKRLHEYDDKFKLITKDQMQKGFEISLKVKEFDKPEEYLSEDELLCLSAYYEYMALIESDNLKKYPIDDDFEFDPTDLEEE